MTGLVKGLTALGPLFSVFDALTGWLRDRANVAKGKMIAKNKLQARSIEALQEAREADHVADAVVQEAESQVEAENEAARQAATGSDDPLRAGLDQLRNDRSGRTPT